MDYAISGHEEAADVPIFNRPNMPDERVEKLRVVQLLTSSTGHLYLRYPKEIAQYRASILQKSNFEGMLYKGRRKTKQFEALESETEVKIRVPDHITAYFFKRWVWANFPLLAVLPECDLWATSVAADMKRCKVGVCMTPPHESSKVQMFSVVRADTVVEPPIPLTKASAHKLGKVQVQLAHSKSTPLFATTKLPDILNKRKKERDPEKEYFDRVEDIRRVNERLCQQLNQIHERRADLQRQVKEVQLFTFGD